MHPVLQTGLDHEVFNNRCGALPKKINTHAKKQQVDDSRDQYPFPQIMLIDKLVSPEIRLDSYDNFFKQSGFLFLVFCFICLGQG